MQGPGEQEAQSADQRGATWLGYKLSSRVEEGGLAPAAEKDGGLQGDKEEGKPNKRVLDPRGRASGDGKRVNVCIGNWRFFVLTLEGS